MLFKGNKTKEQELRRRANRIKGRSVARSLRGNSKRF
jgi:hypothetical protein